MYTSSTIKESLISEYAHNNADSKDNLPIEKFSLILVPISKSPEVSEQFKKLQELLVHQLISEIPAGQLAASALGFLKNSHYAYAEAILDTRYDEIIQNSDERFKNKALQQVCSPAWKGAEAEDEAKAAFVFAKICEVCRKAACSDPELNPFAVHKSSAYWLALLDNTQFSVDAKLKVAPDYYLFFQPRELSLIDYAKERATEEPKWNEVIEKIKTKIIEDKPLNLGNSMD